MSRGLTRSEAQRKLVHLGVGGFAFLLRFMTCGSVESRLLP